jgi:hypothetical protein
VLRNAHGQTIDNSNANNVKQRSNLQKLAEINPIVVVRVERFENKLTIFVRFSIGIETLQERTMMND